MGVGEGRRRGKWWGRGGGGVTGGGVEGKGIIF